MKASKERGFNKSGRAIGVEENPAASWRKLMVATNPYRSDFSRTYLYGKIRRVEAASQYDLITSQSQLGHPFVS